MLKKIASNYLQNQVKKEYNNPQVRDALRRAGISAVKDTAPAPTTIRALDFLNNPARDQQGNVTFPGYNNIYDNDGNIIKYEPIKNAPHAKPNQPIGRPLSILQKSLTQNKWAQWL